MVSAKVGMDCWGFLVVRKCCMPFSPNQSCSLINPLPLVVLSSARYTSQRPARTHSRR